MQAAAGSFETTSCWPKCAFARGSVPELSDQGVTGLGDEESTAIGWLTAAVQKCARALDLARCLEGTLIGDGRALTI